jgi:hypothetical protein
MVVGRLFNPFANRKFRHRMFLFGNLMRDSPPNSLTVLKQRRRDFGQTETEIAPAVALSLDGREQIFSR